MAGLSRMAVMSTLTRKQEMAVFWQVVLAPEGIGSVGSKNKKGSGVLKRDKGIRAKNYPEQQKKNIKMW